MDLDNIVLNTPEQTAEARKLFESHKEQLIKDWEATTGREWPKYEKDVIDPVTGKVLRHAGDRYDAHHILPLSWGGKNTAGNLTPLDISSHKDVHQAGSAFNLLRKLLDVGQGLNTQGFSLNSAIIANLLRGE